MYDFERRSRITQAIDEALSARDRNVKPPKCIICGEDRISSPTVIKIKADADEGYTAQVIEVAPVPSEKPWVTLTNALGDASRDFLVCPECAARKGIVQPDPMDLKDCTNPDCFNLNEGRPEPAQVRPGHPCPKCGQVSPTESGVL